MKYMALLRVGLTFATGNTMLNFLRKTSLWIILIPAAIWGTGFASNQAVLMANHGTFPVLCNAFKAQAMRIRAEAARQEANDESDDESVEIPEGYLDFTHIIMTKDTHLNALADVFDLKGDGIYSIGDFLLMLGEWLGGFSLAVWIFEAVRRLRS